jgi:hypothetical protein
VLSDPEAAISRNVMDLARRLLTPEDREALVPEAAPAVFALERSLEQPVTEATARIAASGNLPRITGHSPMCDAVLARCRFWLCSMH